MGMPAVSRFTTDRRGRRATPALILTLTALTGLSGCAGPHYVLSRPLEIPAATAPAISVTKNVVLVSIDGLRPDAIDRFSAPTLQRLMREGSYSLDARTIMPSTTLPSHTSMLSGEPPEEHGVLWNNVASAKADVVEFSTVFSVARQHGYKTAAFFSKAKFSPLQRPGTLDYSQAPGGWFGRWSSERTVHDARAYLQKERPNLLFVHFSDADSAGHGSGWMSAAYGRAVQTTDAALGQLLAAAEETYGAGNYSVLVTADHGGHDYGHGTKDARDVNIPWIAWGQGVKAGVIDEKIDTYDTAPTVLWLLGVKEPDGWDGEPVVEAFRPLAPTSAD
jgi:predicted AlkP superfamily pyrophosphatase or phosphodiesterase